MTDDLLICDLVIAVLAVHIDLSEEYNSSDLHVFISHYNQTISVWFSDYWQTYKPMVDTYSKQSWSYEQGRFKVKSCGIYKLECATRRIADWHSANGFVRHCRLEK